MQPVLIILPPTEERHFAFCTCSSASVTICITIADLMETPANIQNAPASFFCDFFVLVAFGFLGHD
jgi:hypothetical protein